MDVASADGITPATKAGIAGGAWTHPKDSTPADYVSTVKASVPKAILPNPIPDAVQPKVVPALQQAQQEVLLKGTSIQQAYTQAQDSLNAMLK
jgi:multiple sugar transport system substrate-binding protein